MRKIDYLTYGRDAEFFGNLFTQTVPVLISLILGSAPILLLPMSNTIQSLLFGVVSTGLLISLCITVNQISKRTYSVGLRRIQAQTLSVCMYSLLGGVAIFCGYLVFVTPHPHPAFTTADFALGTAYSLLYAELAAVGLVTSVRSKAQTNELSQDIEEFIALSDKFEEGTRNVEEKSSERLVQLSRSIVNSIEEEPASGTKEVAQRLDRWADKFENEGDFVGRGEQISSDEFSKLTSDLCTLQ